MKTWVPRISIQLPVIVVLVVAVTAITIGIFSYIESSNEIRNQANQKLIALRESRHSALSQLLQAVETDLALLADSADVKQALQDFEPAFRTVRLSLADGFAATMQGIYRPDAMPGDAAALGAAPIPVREYYDRAHRAHHDRFARITDAREYYDLFLLSLDGDVLYTVRKEADFSTNLVDGQWALTGLAKVFDAATRADAGDRISIVDFEPYQPSEDAPAAFAARTVTIGETPVGVVAIQLPIGRINRVMQVTAGMGNSGETYIVGADLLMRSDSRFSDRSTIMTTRVDTPAVAAALSGDTGIGTIEDYRGVPVLSAYGPFEYLGITWALLAEIDVDEIMIPVDAMRNSITLIALGLAGLIAIAGYMVAGTITRPLRELAAAVTRFRKTRVIEDVPHRDRGDEIGDIARSFGITLHELDEYISGLKETRDELQHSQSELVSSRNRLVAIMESAPDAIISAKRDGTIVAINAAVRDMLGWETRDLIGHDISMVIPQTHHGRHPLDDGGTMRRAPLTDYQGGTTEWCALRKDGGEIPIELTISSWAEDNTAYLTTIMRDISERRETERQLAESRETVRAIVEQLPASVAIKNLDDEYVETNNKFKEWFLGPDRDVTGQTTAAVYSKEMAEELRAIDRSVIETLSPVTREILQPFPDGTEHLLEMTKFPVFNAAGAVIGIGTIDFDITEFKKTEKLLAEQENVLKESTEHMPAAMLVCDPDLNIAFVSRGYKDLFGDPKGLLAVGTPIQQVIEDEIDRGIIHGTGTRENLVKERVQSFRTQRRTQFEDIAEDGRTIMTTRNPGSGGYSITIGIDISDRKQAEVALEASLRRSEQFNKLAVNRELRMIELKHEVDELAQRLGEKPRYAAEPAPAEDENRQKAVVGE